MKEAMSPKGLCGWFCERFVNERGRRSGREEEVTDEEEGRKASSIWSLGSTRLLSELLGTPGRGLFGGDAGPECGEVLGTAHVRSLVP